MLAQRIINVLKYLPCGGTGFCKRLAHTHGLTALPWKNKSPHRPDTPLALHNVTLCDTKCIVMQDGFGQELDRQWPTCKRLACKMSSNLPEPSHQSVPLCSCRLDWPRSNERRGGKEGVST